MHADEQVVEAAPHRPGKVSVLYGVEELRLVYMAAQGMSHAVVPQRTHRAIQLQRVVVELQQVHALRKLQDVNAPGGFEGDSLGFKDENSREHSTVHQGFAGPNLFSSGMWRAIMVSGSWQRTSQPSRSLTRPVSGLRKLLGMRLQMTGVNIWTSSRGGHWGTGFLRSLRNMAVDIGMMFWARQAKIIANYSVYDFFFVHCSSTNTKGISPL